MAKLCRRPSRSCEIPLPKGLGNKISLFLKALLMQVEVAAQGHDQSTPKDINQISYFR